MPDSKNGKTAVDAKLDAAITAAAAVPPMARLQITLSGGRAAAVDFPIPLSPEDALRITASFAAAYLQSYDTERARAITPSGLVLPS